MRKLILSLIILTTFSNVIFASFPIIVDTLEMTIDTLQTEEIKQYHYSLQQMGIDLKYCKCESCRNGISPLTRKPDIVHKKEEIQMPKEKTEPNGNLFVFLSVLSALAAIVFAFLSLSSALVHNGNPFPYLILTLVSIVTSIVSGINAKKRGSKTAKAFLGLGLLVLGVLLFMVLLS
tara:strand:+ start:161 stop:691 length:531 start_codon:yes stop_codon:yes gene_type:complete